MSTVVTVMDIGQTLADLEETMPDERLRYSLPLFKVADHEFEEIPTRVVVEVELHRVGVHDRFMENHDSRMIVKNVPQDLDFERFRDALAPLLNLADAQTHIGPIL